LPNDRIQIRQNVNRRYPHHAAAVGSKIRISNGIVLRSIAAVVRLAVDFNRKRGLVAVEIDDVRTCRLLTPEFQAVRTGSERTPEDHFR